jgi:hypothetical protein
VERILEPGQEDSGVAIVMVFLTAMQENLYFALSALVMVLVCFVYDMRLCARQTMAKSLLVWKYLRKFERYNVHMEWRKINSFHKWLGISVRQYVYVFLPIQPETGPGEAEPSAEATSVTFEIERFLLDKGEALFVAVQNKSW